MSAAGEAEAVSAAKVLQEKGYKFDCAYTSVLKRAIHTCWSVLKESDQSHVPITNCWRLNERHYGALQGLNKSETAAKHGEEQVKIWRRAYDVAPPCLEKTDTRWPGNDAVYARVPKDVLPVTECLKDTVERGMSKYRFLEACFCFGLQFFPSGSTLLLPRLCLVNVF